MRTAKRFAYAVFAAFVLSALPLYIFIFHLSALELTVALGPVFLTVAAIEMFSRWEYRMRRRHAYPHLLGYRLAAIHQFYQAFHDAAGLLAELI